MQKIRDERILRGAQLALPNQITKFTEFVFFCFPEVRLRNSTFFCGREGDGEAGPGVGAHTHTNGYMAVCGCGRT